MNKSLITVVVVLGVLGLCGCIIGSILLGMYNQPINLKIGVEEQLGIVAVMTQRQADVVMQAQAGFGQVAGLDNAQILGFVAEAEALSGSLAPYCNRATGTCNLPQDPAIQAQIVKQMEQFDQSSIRFIAYVQQHPQLRTADAFDTFMIAVEGSANRVSTERRTLQQKIGNLKTNCLNPPGSFFCSMRGVSGNEFRFFETVPGTENMPTPGFPTPVMP